MLVMSEKHSSEIEHVQPLPRTLRGLHWATVALLVVMFGLAWTFDWLRPSDLRVSLIDFHRSCGILLFLVVVARLAWRATHRLDPVPQGSPRWEHWLASGVQGALYACLLAMPVLGWVASAMSGDTIKAFGLTLPDVISMNEDRSDWLFELHGTLAWVLLALTGLHVAGALRHHFVKRDGLINRMRLW